MGVGSLDGLLREANPTFEPWSHYDESTDSLQVYIEDGMCMRCRVDEFMTFYEDPGRGILTGCMLKGVKALIGKLGSGYNACIAEGGKVRLSIAGQNLTAAQSLPKRSLGR